MATPKDLPRDIGGFIRDLRRNAQFSLRQLAEQAGVSNPYLSQIERGLRKPSAEVLQQLASALRVSTPAMYLRAGLLDDKDGPGVLTAIAADAELTIAQKQSLSQIYETFRRENARHAETEAQAEAQTKAAKVEAAAADLVAATAEAEAAAATAAAATVAAAAEAAKADAAKGDAAKGGATKTRATPRKATKKAAKPAEEE
jgi:transcriptional regulator with XRE-family HTH domain